MQDAAIWFLAFVCYSFIGWLLEVVVSLIERHRFVNRGFLIGPLCPIYGTGALLITFCLGSVKNPLAIFATSILLSAILEYSTSYLMEKLFHVRWWDYSRKPFNLHGRICLESLIIFGLSGLLIVTVVSPFFYQYFSALPLPLLYTLATILFLALLADFIISLYFIKGFRVTVGIAAKDATIEISERVRQIIMSKGKLSRRLLKAFPDQKPSPHPTHRRTTKRASRSTPHPKSPKQ